MERLKSLIKSKPKILAILVVLMTLSLPFIINQILKEQDIRQGAQTLDPVTITYSPLTQTIAVNQKFNVQLIIDTKSYDISAIEGYLKYDSSKITLSKVEATDSPFTVIQGEQINDNGMIAQQIIAYNNSANTITGSDKVFATVIFVGKAPGTTQISFGAPSNGSFNIAASGISGSIPTNPQELPTYTIVEDCTTLATGRPDACYCTSNSQCASNDCRSSLNGPTPLPGGNQSSNICWPNVQSNSNLTSPTPTNNSTTFNYNGGKDHCRPTVKSCESSLNESEVPNSSCSSYLGVNARVCRTSGYPPVTNSLLSECSTLSPDGYVRYCIPDGREIPAGWTAVSSGDEACTDYNGVASKCYKSTFLASNSNQTQNPSTTSSPSTTPYPANTVYPTPTNNPGETYIKFSFQLPGIGIGSANLGLNSTPLDSQRSAWITVLDYANNTIVNNKQGIATYNSTSGKYEGSIGLGSTFAPTPTLIPALSDKFIIKIKVNNSLYKRIPGIATIHYGIQNNLTPEVELVSGDLNGDNTLGIIDWTFMIACVKNETSCTENIKKLADLNNNGSVDEIDVQILQRGFALREGD